MKIESKSKAIFEFTPETHFLVYSDSRKLGKEWSLSYRIDRSEKGKDDECGIEVIYLTNEEAEKVKKVGFSWIEL